MKLAPFLVLAIATPTWVVEGQITWRSCQLFRSPQAPSTPSLLARSLLRNHKTHIPACNAHNSQNSPLQSSPRDTSSAHQPSTDSHPPGCLRHLSNTDSLPDPVSQRRYCARDQRLWRRDSAPILRPRRRGASPRLGPGGGQRYFCLRRRVLGRK